MFNIFAQNHWKLKIIRCFFWLAALFYCAMSAASGKNALNDALLKQGYIAVPLYLAASNNTLLVDLTLNQSARHTLILDTGSANSVITDMLARQLKATFTQATIIAGDGGGRRVVAHQVLVPTLKLSGLTIPNTTFYVEAINIPIKSHGKLIEGLLGIDFLVKNQAIIDIANQWLYLKIHNDNTFSIDKLGYRPIALQRTPSGHLTIFAAVNKAAAKTFLLDTGVPVTLIDINYARLMNLASQTENRTVKGAGTQGGSMKMKPVIIQRLQVGTVTDLHKAGFIFDLKYAQVGTPLAGVIGLDWMQAHQAIIDMATQKVYVKN